jgi:hypothetical protein
VTEKERVTMLKSLEKVRARTGVFANGSQRAAA